MAYPRFVFEGLFSPWHLLILAVVLFVVVGPRKVAARWHDLRDAGRRLTGEPENEDSGSANTPPKRSVAYRLGQRLRRR
jgi:Sec-independent protein translocase protein TatA